MPVLHEAEELIVSTVRRFVEREVRPVAREIQHTNTYPHDLIENMKQHGVFGLVIPERFGGADAFVPSQQDLGLAPDRPPTDRELTAEVADRLAVWEVDPCAIRWETAADLLYRALPSSAGTATLG